MESQDNLDFDRLLGEIIEEMTSLSSQPLDTELLDTSKAVETFLLVGDRRTMESGTFHRLNPRRTTLGRHLDNDIILAAKGVSRSHCYIVNQGGTHWIYDAGCSNGTSLNEEFIGEEGAPLRHQDNIVLGGRLVIVYVYLKVSDSLKTRLLG